MCGRYAFFTPLHQVAAETGANPLPYVPWEPTYNAAPTQILPVITQEFPTVIQFFRWGLVPKWAKELSIGNKLINTKWESIQEKPALKNIARYQRCVVPANGYFEWVTGTGLASKKQKQPYYIYKPHLLFMAGIWDTWQGELQSFSIITLPAAENLASLHHRMPALLDLSMVYEWLSGKAFSANRFPDLCLRTSQLLQWHPISNEVNQVSNNTPSLIQPYQAPPPLQQSLF